MGFQRKNNLGGRPKGSKNKASKVVAEIVEAALKQSLPGAILELLQTEHDPDFRLKVFELLMPYCYSKLAPTLVPPPLSPQEEALKQRQFKELTLGLDSDPNPG